MKLHEPQPGILTEVCGGLQRRLQAPVSRAQAAADGAGYPAVPRQ